MHIPVRCKTCGMPINDKATIYLAALAEKVKAELKRKNITPAEAEISDFQVKVGDILDKLHLHAICCRNTMITTMNHADYY